MFPNWHLAHSFPTCESRQSRTRFSRPQVCSPNLLVMTGTLFSSCQKAFSTDIGRTLVSKLVRRTMRRTNYYFRVLLKVARSLTDIRRPPYLSPKLLFNYTVINPETRMTLWIRCLAGGSSGETPTKLRIMSWNVARQQFRKSAVLPGAWSLWDVGRGFRVWKSRFR